MILFLSTAFFKEGIRGFSSVWATFLGVVLVFSASKVILHVSFYYGILKIYGRILEIFIVGFVLIRRKEHLFFFCEVNLTLVIRTYEVQMIFINGFCIPFIFFHIILIKGWPNLLVIFPWFVLRLFPPKILVLVSVWRVWLVVPKRGLFTYLFLHFGHGPN